MGGRAGRHMGVYSWFAFDFEIEGYNGLLLVFLNFSKSGRNDLQNGTEGVHHKESYPPKHKV